MTHQDKLRADFDAYWNELAEAGKVDALGSAQYTRVRTAFEATLPRRFAELWLDEALKHEGHSPPAHGHGKKKHDNDK